MGVNETMTYLFRLTRVSYHSNIHKNNNGKLETLHHIHYKENYLRNVSSYLHNFFFLIRLFLIFTFCILYILF